MPDQQDIIGPPALPVSDRVIRLRQRLIETRPEVFAERALLMTEAYRESENHPAVLRRAWALKRILEHIHIDIRPDEWIVGCKTPLSKGSPLYPEFNVKWLVDELDTLSGRTETPFDVSEPTIKDVRESVIPYWKGRTVYDGIVQKAPAPALAAASEGLLFHYYLDRSIGHITVNYEKVLKIGISGLIAQINHHLTRLSPTQAGFEVKRDFYNALLIVADAAITFARRHGALASELANQCDDRERREELHTIARICRRVPEYPAESLPEALQSFWFIHLILNLESNSYAISPGRFCQYIYPFYRADMDNGALKESEAQEWLNCLWIKFNELTVVKAGATAKASNTYVDFQNLNIGGLKPDGRDGTNDISYLCLNAHAALKLTQPQLSCLISSKTDHAFLMRSGEVIRQGTGMPSVFNDDVKVISLLTSGKTLADARGGGVNGCVEVNAQGCDNMASTGYVNLVKCLELALNDGISMTTGAQLGPQTGKAEAFETFDDLWQAFSTQLEAAVSLKVAYDQAARQVFAEMCPVVFTSLVMDDCIDKGLDFHQGGARYNAPMMCAVGLGTLADSLAALQKFCFTNSQYNLTKIRDALADNYAAQPLLQKQLWNKGPKFGNNDDRVDQIACDIVKRFSDILCAHTNEHGETYRANMIPTTNHIPMGHATAASPDGRFKGAPLSEGVSPVQGQDVSGPTGVILSLAKVDHAGTAGTLLNMKFTPAILTGRQQLEKFAQLIRTYFSLGGYHMQFNVVSEATLLAAQKDPKAHRNLIVRVAGYSDYFISLSKDIQDEIIMRTTHGVH
jgi:trans-4-hydroxy-L-proline dehydratase